VVSVVVGVGCRDHSSSSTRWLTMTLFGLRWEILVGISRRSVALVEKMHFVLRVSAFKADDTDRLREGVEMVVVGRWHR